MKEIFIGILASILKSIAFSTVMLIASLSLLTHQFPPSFKSVQTSYQGLMKLREIALQTMPSTNGDAVSDVELLEKINQQRRMISSSLLGSGPTVPVPNDDAKFQQLEQKVLLLESEVNDLKGRCH